MDPQIPLATVALAISSHLYYRKNEPHPYVFARNTLLLPFGASLFFLWRGHLPLDALLLSLFQFAVYLSALGASIAIYRTTPLHPLSHIPGPFLAKLTQLWFFRQAMLGRTRHTLQEMHARYGDVVRVGPNEISVANADAIHPIHGYVGGGWTKGWAYQTGAEAFNPHETNENLFSLGTHQLHSTRRKLWDRAFTTKALHTYQKDIVEHVTVLRDQLAKVATTSDGGATTDLAFWLTAMVHDVMSSFTFSEGHDLVGKGKDHEGVLQLGDEWPRAFGLIRFLPWLKPLLCNKFVGWKAAIAFKEYSTNLFLQRARKGAERTARGEVDTPDVFYWLLGENLTEEEKEAGGYEKLNDVQLALDSLLIIAAGSDTSRTTLTTLFYYLLKTPHLYKRLQSELDCFPAELSVADFPALSKLPFLTALVNEALRLQPPVSSGAQRLAPPGGAILCDTYIAEGTATRIPAYVVHRDPRYFSNPDQFNPDRWLPSSTEKVHDKNAFFPFLVGPYACIGKQVALHEMRYAVAAIVRSFDLELVDDGKVKGQDWVDLIEDTLLCEIKGPLKTRLSLRKA